MYINLRKKYTKRLPIEVLGGNIITMVDIFCESIPDSEPIGLDRFEAIKTKLHDLTGKLFLEEVVEAFVDMIQDEMLAVRPDERFGQVMVYAGDPEKLASIKKRLKREGFRVISDRSFDSFIDLYQRGRPDMIILLVKGGVEEIGGFVDDFVAGGVEVDKVPTFLLTDTSVTAQSTVLLEKGIEDVVPLDDNLSLLIVKMKKIRSRIEAEAGEHEKIDTETGSYGSLENMNLIDLLQALGPSRKTVRMVVSSGENELVMYLNHGDIVFAQNKRQVGAEAVYAAMAWTRGNWKIQPVEEDELPEPNNEYSNESILMEGCRLLDESSRAEDSESSTQKIRQTQQGE
jgi:DNA-binding response OmpR family regulator